MEDRQIVELYWQKSEDAIKETDRKYRAYCFTIANNILCNRQDSEECVNDTWLNAWNAIPPQKPKVLQTFLAKNLLIYMDFDLLRNSHPTVPLYADGCELLVFRTFSQSASVSKRVFRHAQWSVSVLIRSINYLRNVPQTGSSSCRSVSCQIICQRHRAASQKTSFVLAVRFRKSPPRTCAAAPSAPPHRRWCRGSS